MDEKLTYDQLFDQYKKQIEEEFDWEAIVSEAKSNIAVNEYGDMEGSAFLGTVFSIFPSGVYYTPWARSNVSDDEIELDTAYSDALMIVCADHGLIYEHGEFDPCDIFVVYFPEDEGEKE